jgi:hypothetical protein
MDINMEVPQKIKNRPTLFILDTKRKVNELIDHKKKSQERLDKNKTNCETELLGKSKELAFRVKN